MHRRENTHDATVTFELPTRLSFWAVIELLRAAGVPVNDPRQVEVGSLFARWHCRTNSTVFRRSLSNQGYLRVGDSQSPSPWRFTVGAYPDIVAHVHGVALSREASKTTIDLENDVSARWSS